MITSIATNIQNGHKTHTHDHDATGWIANSFNTTKTIPTTARQPMWHEQEEWLDELELFDIMFPFMAQTTLLS
jgi:hypothetical protein